jgi:hypothetical protein
MRGKNSKMAPRAAINSRATWPPGPAKLAPGFAATDKKTEFAGNIRRIVARTFEASSQ